MKRYLVGLGCALAIFSTSAIVNAATHVQTQPTNTTPTQYQGKYHGKYIQLANVNCRWVGGYWRYGMWHPGRKVCYGYKPYHYKKYYKHKYNCKWVGGYWRHGIYYPSKRVCW